MLTDAQVRGARPSEVPRKLRYCGLDQRSSPGKRCFSSGHRGVNPVLVVPASSAHAQADCSVTTLASTSAHPSFSYGWN